LGRSETIGGFVTANAARAGLRLRGHTLLELTLDRLAEAGVGDVTLNITGDQTAVTALLHARTAGPAWSLGTALPASAEIFVADAEMVWLDGPTAALGRLRQALAPGVDGVVLVHRSFQVQADVGLGDFFIDPLGLPRRRVEGEISPYVYAGVTLARPALLAGTGGFTAAIDRAIEAGRLRAVVHDGLWFHLASEADLDEAEAALAAQVTGPTT